MTTLLLLSLLLQAPGFAGATAGEPLEEPSAPAQRVQAWLTTVYPALRRGDTSVAIYGDAVTARLVVTTQSARRVPGDTTPAPVLLVADLHRSRVTGRLEALQARGPLVQSDKLAALTSAVTSHP